MYPDPTMTEALRLTRAGNLSGATSLIQAMLAGRGTNATPPQSREGDVIELIPIKVTSRNDGGADRRSAGSDPRGPASGFLEYRYSSPAGRLDYLRYVPNSGQAAMPVVVMLHGCTQSPEDFARGTQMNQLADELGFVVVYPRQTQAANAQRCWNWFKPGDQQRDSGEPALIAGIVLDVVRDCGADPTRIYVAGLSAGGAAAAILAARYPDLFAAVGIHSGLGCGAARDLPSALAAMRGGGLRPISSAACGLVPTITFHGDRDRTVDVSNSGQIVAAATQAANETLEITTLTGRSSGGTDFTRASSRDTSGRVLIEQWTIHGAGHAWSGGSATGSYTDPRGPDASREMLRFFLGHSLQR